MKLSSPPSPPLLAHRHVLREEEEEDDDDEDEDDHDDDDDNDVVARTKRPQLKPPHDDTLSVTSCTTQGDDIVTEAAVGLSSPPPPPRLSWMESTSMHSFDSMHSSTSTLPPSSSQPLSSPQRQVHFQERVQLIHDNVEDAKDDDYYDTFNDQLWYSPQEMQQFKQSQFRLARSIVAQHASRRTSWRRTWFHVVQEAYCECRQPQQSSKEDGLLAEESSSPIGQRDVQHYFRDEYLGLEYHVTLPPDDDYEQSLAVHHNLCHDRCQRRQAMWQQINYWQQPGMANLVNARSRITILQTTCAQLSRPACLLARRLAHAVAISVQEDAKQNQSANVV